MTTVVDLSNNNPGPINWAALVHVCGGMIHKASQGVDFVDGLYQTRKQLARQWSIPFAAYHFAETGTDPAVNASLFVHVAGRDVPLLLDLETGDPTVAENWARAFNARVHQLTGRWPGFYSYRDFIDRMGIQHGPIGGGLWLADYGPNDGHPHTVQPPAPWKHVMLHQYTSRGRIAGVPGLVDLSLGQMPR